MASKPKLDHRQLHNLPAPIQLLCCMSSKQMLTSDFLVAKPSSLSLHHRVYDITVISISYEMRHCNSLVPPAGFDPAYPKGTYSVDENKGSNS